MIFPPMSEADPAVWAAVFAGHMAVGVGLAIILGGLVAVIDRGTTDEGPFIDSPAGLGAGIGTLGYFTLWEALWQAFGAGVADALTDTLAVALGALIAAALWERRLPVGVAALAVGIGAIWRGIRRRL